MTKFSFSDIPGYRDLDGWERHLDFLRALPKETVGYQDAIDFAEGIVSGLRATSEERPVERA